MDKYSPDRCDKFKNITVYLTLMSVCSPICWGDVWRAGAVLFMSDFILARVSQTLAAEQSLETLVRQLQAANVALELHSSTDELTQLPNRRALFKQLALRFASARAQQQQVSLIFIDLDGFKAINDRFGHPCGDSFLVQVGKRLTAVARREDIVGRLGGDEFLIVGSAQQPAAQQAYVTSLRQALCGVYFLGEQRIDYEGASFGVVTCDPQSIDVEAALRAADEAMYQDKKSRRQENFIHID
ncbi:TPA: GGDEF domain-containing protein [Klebsiella pneumoniae]|nr:GGDEF domain-containing protein [Klebsiella pneumoniae]HBY0058435.1 GGDEF domain-containing protein [Klebsiella pneumoniae]